MKLARVGAVLAVLLIALVSIVPGSVRPELIESGRFEHFVAYVVAGFLLGFAYPGRAKRILSGLLLSICAGASEVVQLWIPGRTASIADFAISTLGAWLSLVLLGVLDRARDRRAVSDFPRVSP